jgi:hypothetical protein
MVLSAPPNPGYQGARRLAPLFGWLAVGQRCSDFAPFAAPQKAGKRRACSATVAKNAPVALQFRPAAWGCPPDGGYPGCSLLPACIRSCKYSLARQVGRSPRGVPCGAALRGGIPFASLLRSYLARCVAAVSPAPRLLPIGSPDHAIPAYCSACFSRYVSASPRPPRQVRQPPMLRGALRRPFRKVIL